MFKLNRIALVCYLLLAAAAAFMGVRYIFADQIMPYHLEAVGLSWPDLPAGFQIMMLGLMKGVGLGMLVLGLATGFLALVPFRRGEGWSRWAIALITVTYSAVMLYLVWTIRSNTPASPPLTLNIILLVVALTGFVLSFPGRCREAAVD